MTTPRLSRTAHLTLPTALALLALVIALSSSATAALVVTGRQIQDGSVTGKDVKDASLKTRDLSPRARTDLRGPAGPAGTPGVSDYTVATAETSIGPASTLGLNVRCPDDRVVIGGGAAWLGAGSDGLRLLRSIPWRVRADGSDDTMTSSTPPNVWHAVGANGSSSSRLLTVTALCARVPS